jgi:hypothetical protein
MSGRQDAGAGAAQGNGIPVRSGSGIAHLTTAHP